MRSDHGDRRPISADVEYLGCQTWEEGGSQLVLESLSSSTRMEMWSMRSNHGTWRYSGIRDIQNEAAKWVQGFKLRPSVVSIHLYIRFTISTVWLCKVLLWVALKETTVAKLGGLIEDLHSFANFCPAISNDFTLFRHRGLSPSFCSHLDPSTGDSGVISCDPAVSGTCPRESQLLDC